MIDDKRLPLKEKVIDYLTHMPFYKWAAKSIGKDEDTLIIWRKEDPDFADRCETAKSEAIKKLGRRATPDFMLACADPKTFSKKLELKVTELPKPLLDGLHHNDRTEKTVPTEKKG